MEIKPPLILFLGPTAVGKTRLAIDVARCIKQAEIISCDSRLFYRGMDIGTAKPKPEEVQGIRHHMIDIANPDQIISLGLFQKMVKEIISDIRNRGNLPFLVGGTGQYVRAVTQGWTVPEVLPNQALRAYLEIQWNTHGLAELHRWLKILDRQAYESVDLRNPRRVLRALEIILTSGQKLASQRTRADSPYHLIQIGLAMPRSDLFTRIDCRIDEMMKQGLEEEVLRLLNSGYSSDLPSMSAIGYQEMAAYIHKEMSLDEAVILMKRRTHAFVRRQANWFKESDPDIHWFDVNTTTADMIKDFIFACVKSNG